MISNFLNFTEDIPTDSTRFACSDLLTAVYADSVAQEVRDTFADVQCAI